VIAKAVFSLENKVKVCITLQGAGSFLKSGACLAMFIQSLPGMEKRLHCIIFRLGLGNSVFLFGAPWANGDLSSQ